MKKIVSFFVICGKWIAVLVATFCDICINDRRYMKFSGWTCEYFGHIKGERFSDVFKCNRCGCFLTSDGKRYPK